MNKQEFEKALEDHGYCYEDGHYVKMKRGLKVCVEVSSLSSVLTIHVGGTLLTHEVRYAYLTRGWDNPLLASYISLLEREALTCLRTWRQVAKAIGSRLDEYNNRRARLLDGRVVDFCEQLDGSLVIVLLDKEGGELWSDCSAHYPTRLDLYRSFLAVWEATK